MIEDVPPNKRGLRGYARLLPVARSLEANIGADKTSKPAGRSRRPF